MDTFHAVNLLKRTDLLLVCLMIYLKLSTQLTIKLKELEYYGNAGKILRWFENYLKDRE